MAGDGDEAAALGCLFCVAPPAITVLAGLYHSVGTFMFIRGWLLIGGFGLTMWLLFKQRRWSA